jgi:hypothetical protein
MNLNLFLVKKYHFFFLFLFFYGTLILGFILGENTLGGSVNDYQNHKIISQKFADNFFEVLLNYDKEATRHSPILTIILSFFEKLQITDNSIRIINLHFLLLIVLYFYKSLIIKLKKYNKFNIYLISLLLFLSPTYRSLSIWPDSRLYGLLFFVMSIYFYVNFTEEKNNKKKFKFSLLNSLCLCLASYFSPNFSLFVVFFLVSYFKYYKINKYFFSLIILNFFLSLPAIYYIFFLKIFFFLNSVSFAGETIVALNPANKIILIASIFLFHYLPFFFVTKGNYKITLNNFIILLIIFLICIYYFNYTPNYTGGGIIYKFSNIIFNNNYFLYFFSFIGFLFLFTLCYKNTNNFLLVLLIILGNPQLEIYHKYYDPMLLILFFTLFKINLDKQILKKRIIIFYFFNFLFLVANLLR